MDAEDFLLQPQGPPMDERRTCFTRLLCDPAPAREAFGGRLFAILRLSHVRARAAIGFSPLLLSKGSFRDRSMCRFDAEKRDFSLWRASAELRICARAEKNRERCVFSPILRAAADASPSSARPPAHTCVRARARVWACARLGESERVKSMRSPPRTYAHASPTLRVCAGRDGRDEYGKLDEHGARNPVHDGPRPRAGTRGDAGAAGSQKRPASC